MTHSKKYLSLSIIFGAALSITGCIVSPPNQNQNNQYQPGANTNNSYRHAAFIKHAQHRLLVRALVIVGGSIQERCNAFSSKQLMAR